MTPDEFRTQSRPILNALRAEDDIEGTELAVLFMNLTAAVWEQLDGAHKALSEGEIHFQALALLYESRGRKLMAEDMAGCAKAARDAIDATGGVWETSA